MTPLESPVVLVRSKTAAKKPGAWPGIFDDGPRGAGRPGRWRAALERGWRHFRPRSRTPSWMPRPTGGLGARGRPMRHGLTRGEEKGRPKRCEDCAGWKRGSSAVFVRGAFSRSFVVPLPPGRARPAVESDASSGTLARDPGRPRARCQFRDPRAPPPNSARSPRRSVRTSARARSCASRSTGPLARAARSPGARKSGERDSRHIDVGCGLGITIGTVGLIRPSRPRLQKRVAGDDERGKESRPEGPEPPAPGGSGFRQAVP